VSEHARDLVASLEREYRRYKGYAERSFAQVTEAQLAAPLGEGGNSIAVIVWHVSGNLRSRFTDFLASDGEKPWRDRDSEFDDRGPSREELLRKWEEGWAVLFATLASLSDADLGRTISIREERMAVHEALHRSLAHTASHVGQIVLAAKALRGADWETLTIPRRR
jgi:hypothetical protein